MAKKRKKRTKKPNCTNSFSCGFGCISRSRTCRNNVDDKGNKLIETYTEFLSRTAPKPFVPSGNALNQLSKGTHKLFVSNGAAQFSQEVSDLIGLSKQYEDVKKDLPNQQLSDLKLRREFLNTSEEASKYRQLRLASDELSKEAQGLNRQGLGVPPNLFKAIKDADKAVIEEERRLRPKASIFVEQRKFSTQNTNTVVQKVEEIGQSILNKIKNQNKEKEGDIKKELKRIKTSKLHNKEHIEEAALLMGGKGLSKIDKIQVTPNRANYNPQTKTIKTNKQVKSVMFHEMAHAFEVEDPAIYQAAKDFILSRAESGEIQRLKDINRNRKYKNSEQAVVDSFVNPYVGKIYTDKKNLGNIEGSGSTEVISVGLEHFSSPKKLSEFIMKDPEHFNFIAGVLLND